MLSHAGVMSSKLLALASSPTPVPDKSPNGDLGSLFDSTADLGNWELLRTRFRLDGYLMFRQIASVPALENARRRIVAALAEKETANQRLLNKLLRSRSNARSRYSVLHELGSHFAVRRIARYPYLVQLGTHLLESQARLLDHIWVRACGPRRQAPPHCDWVYMCRGSSRLVSAWIPLMDVPISRGPLMLLEQSHRENPHTRDYLQRDADRLGKLNGLRWKHGRLIWGGKYSSRPEKVREEFNARWLTSDFAAGDVVVFDTRCLHATLPNRSDQLRVSIDFRYQPMEDPVDERFQGPNPAVHSNRDHNLYDYWRRFRSVVGLS